VGRKEQLDATECAIERASKVYRPASEENRKRIGAILEHSRKNRNINIRISEPVLAELKRRAEEHGLPYQTLIPSIFHRYVTHRLVDEESLTRALRHLRTFR
jgi:predicted DNA binding CopG/RHH family protein